jgi:hypothetical protein
MVKIIKTELKETVDYDDFIGKTTELEKPDDLTDFFDVTEADDKEWKKHWKEMPEYEQETKKPFKKLIVNFRTKEDYDSFIKLMGQAMTDRTKSIWYPEFDVYPNHLMRWIEE